MPRLLPALVLSVAAIAASAARADDTGVWKALKGKILVSDQPFASSYDSDRAPPFALLMTAKEVGTMTTYAAKTSSTGRVKSKHAEVIVSPGPQ